MEFVSPVLISAGFGVLGVIMARRRRRNGLFWGLLGALFPIVLLILLILPRIKSTENT